MDILIYLLIIGLGVAADRGPVYDDQYDSSANDGSYSGDSAGVDDGTGTPDPADGSTEMALAPPADLPPGLMAEDQVVDGRMTTATEVRPILSATRPNWIAVRDYDGRDLLYFTNLLAWRCGLVQIAWSVNGGETQVLAMEPCHTDTSAPNAMTMDSYQPYVELPEQSVQSVHVELVYDDLSQDAADYQRAEVEIN